MKFSAEHRAKISAALKGHAVSAATRAKIGAKHHGIALSKEHRAKIAASLRGNPALSWMKGRRHSKATRAKIATAGRGRHHSKATRLTMRQNQLGSRNSFFGRRHSKQTLRLIGKKLTGRVFTAEHRARISARHRGKHLSDRTRELIRRSREGKYFGKNNPNWNGGVTSLKKLIRKSRQYRLWRHAIFARDSYLCILCGANGSLEADHYPTPFAVIIRRHRIRSLRTALRCPELWDIRNGRTLCRPCHKATPNYAKPISQWQTT